MPFVFAFWLKKKKEQNKAPMNSCWFVLFALSSFLFLTFLFFFPFFASNLFWIFSFLFFPPFFLNPRSAHKKTRWIFNEQASRRRYFCCMFFPFSCFQVFLGDVYTQIHTQTDTYTPARTHTCTHLLAGTLDLRWILMCWCKCVCWLSFPCKSSALCNLFDAVIPG